MATSKSRNTLTIANKLQVYEDLCAGMGQDDVARKYNISQGTVSKIKRKAVDGEYTQLQPKQKRNKPPSTYGSIGEALLIWFRNARERKIYVNGTIMMSKLEQLATGMLVKTPSRTWLQKWEVQNKIVYVKPHGEAGSSDEAAAHQWLSHDVPRILTQYELKDIYNADETGLYYKCLPTFTNDFIKEYKEHGYKIDKTRITILVAANADGSDKRELLVIHKWKKPRALKNIPVLPVQYESNPSAWMTQLVFDAWLKKFNDDMKRRNRKVALLLDNASSHKSYTMVGYSNVEVVFMPANTTALVQPMDAGIIANIKQLFRKVVIHKLLDFMEDPENKDKSYEDMKKLIDIRKAIFWLAMVWETVKSKSIANCFSHVGFKSLTHADSHSEEVNESVPVPITEGVLENLDDYINVDKDAPTTGEVEIDDIVKMMVPVDTTSIESVTIDSDDEEEEPPKPPTSSAVLAMLEQVRLYMESAGGEVSLLDKVESNVRMMKFHSQRQTKLDNIFTSTK